MLTNHHDVPPGPLKYCQICGSTNLKEVIDLGHQPLCDELLTKETMDAPEITYPLRLNQCQECTLAQLDYVVSGDQVYPLEYPYRAGISWPVVEAHRQMAGNIVERFGAGFCVDIGSNDGTLLKQFKNLGCQVLGFEPTNIAHFANQEGIATQQAFFSRSAVEETVGRIKAHIVTLTNVFAHMATLGSVMDGITKLLDIDGVLVIENHYLLDILETNQFDSIYHEHVRTYTLTSLQRLFGYYDLEVFDVERVPRYGGNIRVYVGWHGRHPVTKAVGELRDIEDKYDFAHRAKQFRLWVEDARRNFLMFLYSLDGSVAACSAPGRASTLLNYFGVKRGMAGLTWTGELPTSLKLSRYLPGCHLEVVPNTEIVNQQPDYIVLLAWHYHKEIKQRLRAEGVKSALVHPLPYFHIDRT